MLNANLNNLTLIVNKIYQEGTIPAEWLKNIYRAHDNVEKKINRKANIKHFIALIRKCKMRLKTFFTRRMKIIEKEKPNVSYQMKVKIIYYLF